MSGYSERMEASRRIQQQQDHRRINARVWKDCEIGWRMKRLMKVADEKAKAKCPDSDGAQTSAAGEAMTPHIRRAIERNRTIIAAQRRRGDLERWQETFNRLASTPTRGDAEQQRAKAEALELMRQAMPTWR
jgi:hypothetical protein